MNHQNSESEREAIAGNRVMTFLEYALDLLRDRDKPETARHGNFPRTEKNMSSPGSCVLCIKVKKKKTLLFAPKPFMITFSVRT